ncbi:MAG: tannase/feruloyl esterase family alpha/beta hydrolase [Bryobacteraceae bacterium]
MDEDDATVGDGHSLEAKMEFEQTLTPDVSIHSTRVGQEHKPGPGSERSRRSSAAREYLRAVLILWTVIGLGTATGRAQSVSGDDDARCHALETVDFSNIVDAPTQITEARLAKDAGGLLGDPLSLPFLRNFGIAKLTKAIGNVQPTCRVLGYVTPNVGFLLLLPVSHWNGKVLHVGCGGWCGSTASVPIACASHSEYACFGTDMGHTGEGGLWSRNNLQGQVDFSYRATHVATLAGKAIVERYYATAPRKSYFMGCSTGGYQAMVEAQRFPWDFDGIIAGAPDMDPADTEVRYVWLRRNFIGKDGKPALSPADIQLVHGAVRAQCDMDDGVKDGIVSAPYSCKFDPAELQCKAGKQDACLSPLQVQAVRNIYGHMTSKGEPISSRGVFPGSELNWAEASSIFWDNTFFKDTALLATAGTEWKYTDFDFDRDYKRSGAGVLYAATNPDLRKFKAAGGKLLSYQGGNDTTVIPGAVFDYYDTVEKTMGGRAATQDFYRLFTIPGMNHCSGGDGAFAIDYLSYLEAWVEHGQAPNVMIGAHVSGLGMDALILKTPLDPATHVAFTRPVYPYPLHAKYKGTGDPNDAANFAPVEDTSTANDIR